MQLTLTNNTVHAVPIVSANEGRWAETLEPSAPTALSHTNSGLVIVGNEPGVAEQILNGSAELAEIFITNLMTWQSLNGEISADAVAVSVTIQNNGETPVRVTSGYNGAIHNVQSSEIYEATALGYVELSETA